MNSICDIIILTWNKLAVTKECLKSLLSSRAPSLPMRLVVIDNNSSDGTKDYLSSLKDTPNCRFEIVLNKENRGFVRGMNQGLKLSTAPYVCLANNDLIFTKGWLEEIISIFERYSDIGILNPNSNNLGISPPAQIPLAGFAEDLRNRYKGVFMEMPFCIGFCMVIKREVIDKVGGLSEEFAPMFFEDTDYSMKAQKAGYLIGVAKGSYVWHKEHTSLEQLDSEEKEACFLEKRETFLKKWGKTLRIAWIMNDGEELSDNLPEGIGLARAGNFIWFFVRNLTGEGLAIFKRHNLIEHSGVHFVKFKNILDLVWKVAKKKKRYDLIVNKDRWTEQIFSRLGYKVLGDLNIDELERIKKAMADKPG